VPSETPAPTRYKPKFSYIDITVPTDTALPKDEKERRDIKREHALEEKRKRWKEIASQSRTKPKSLYMPITCTVKDPSVGICEHLQELRTKLVNARASHNSS